MTPYYQDDAVTLYHGDCRDASGITADVVIADPPYEQTSLPWDKWPTGWPDAMTRVAPSMWVFGSLRLFMQRREEFGEWTLSHDVVWEKHNGSGFQADRFRRIHESACHFYWGPWRDVYHHPPRVMRAHGNKSVRRRGRTPHLGQIGTAGYVDDGTRLMPSIIYAPSMQGSAENETQKPVQLVAPLVEYGCPPGGTIFSAFAGSGTDLVVAKRTGRKAVGCEVREEQCEIAARRLSQGALSAMFDGEATA